MFILAVVLILLVLVFYFTSSFITKMTGFFVSDFLDKKSDLKKCLEDKDVRLFINSEEAAESLGNMVVSDYLNNVKIVNCARNNKICLQENINEFPTWIVEGRTINREISAEELADFSGCLL